jgi:inosose dehydratase
VTVSSPPTAVVEQGARLRRRLAVGGPLGNASVGTVPILWNNVDIVELRLGADAETVLDDVARTGYDGTQLGLGFPEGDALKGVLAARDLRLAEVYASIPSTIDGPTAGALDEIRERLRLLAAGVGEVLCVAFDGLPERDPFAGRADRAETPRLTDDGWARTVDLLLTIAAETHAAGGRIAFHPHAGTWIETPDEVERLAGSIDAEGLPFCLDVGHYTVGGGDPIEALRRFGERVTHVHLKDVDPEVLAGLRDGTVPGFGAAIRQRLFTELGAGVLDLDGILAVLAGRGYDGWLMVEQDSSWPPPAESAAIGRRVLAAALRRIERTSDAGEQPRDLADRPRDSGDRAPNAGDRS